MAIRLLLPKDLEARFREAAMKRFGFGKGALSRAAEEAIQSWLSTVEEARFEEDPVMAIQGLLKGVKLGSVELQHAVSKMWTKAISKDVSR